VTRPAVARSSQRVHFSAVNTLPKQLVRRVYAKVNLALAVGPPIEPPALKAGFHPIASWMACIDLADELTLVRQPEGEKTDYLVRWFDGKPVEWAPETDLAVRAHRLMEREAGRELPVAMVLHKQIPAGAGLGGGSADAAAVLTGVNEVFGLGLSGHRLRELSTELGSDIAFFIDHGAMQEDGIYAPARPAIVTGFGEEIERLERMEEFPLLLIFPPFGCDTKKVYEAFDEGTPGPLQSETVRRLAQERFPDGERLFNDLAEAAERVEPRIREIRLAVAGATGLPVHVSGSGSTLFLLAGPEFLEPVRRAAPGCRVETAKIL